MTHRRRQRCRSLPALAAAACVAVASHFALSPTFAQQSVEAEAPADASSADPLHEIEARLADRYDRLELLAGRLAELTGTTQPRRAELLRQLVTRGRESDVAGQFDRVVAALNDESYSTALDGETRLQAELQTLLDLLLQEDRDRQLESERKRVLRYLQDVNKLIRLQRGVKARTDGGDDAEELADDQERVAENTEKLQQEIEDSEASPETETSGEQRAEGGERDPSQQSSPSDGDQSKPPKPSEGEPSDGDKQPGDEEREPTDESEEKPEGDQEPGDSSSDEKKPGEQQSGGKPSDKKPGEQSGGQPSEGSQSEGQQSEGQQSEGQQSPPQQSPMQRAAERLKQAQQRMQKAQEQLEQAQRDGAAGEQEAAIEELEQAKADLERILRQLREEELERMLVLLEARFRKMLEEQNQIYDATKKLDQAAATAPAHEIEIAAGRESRRERLIVREADRCLVLLREDGTSVAFPEAVEQARDDMQQIAERLNRSKVDLITQTMEEDVIAALEETLATLQQALDKLRDQRAQQPGGGGGQPGEQALVDQLAELRMIRALQLRVNRRTEQYGALIEGEQALESELLGLLDELALRQAKIFQATHDLETGSNQ